MKILIPVLSFGNAGGYRVLSKIADELIFFGHQVEFLCPEGSNMPYFPTAAKIGWIGSNGIIYEQKDHQPSGKDNFISIQKKLTSALQKIPEDSYDVIIANHSLTVFPVLRSALKHKTLYYVQAYEPDYYRLLGGIKNKILCFLSALTYRKDIFTVVNSAIYKDYKKLDTSNVLYPGIDFSLFYPNNGAAFNQQDDNETIIIGTVGRLERFKGTIYVLDAFNMIRQKYPAAELHVAFGNQADYEGCDGVYCFQPKGDKALGDYYRSLNYYFCAGFTQIGAFHYPIVEAMACGIPVITTQYNPADDNNSWLTDICNVPDIVKKFELALNNPQLKDEKVQQAIIDTKQFNWKRTGQQLNFYLNELVNISMQKVVK